ncbi:hypothetical protein B0H11DRAFT_2193934 [Mycena galericulata]|nr:hypothetical protein B0H11DRAFT_2193934 [Mycena galericulata]
MPSLAFHLLAPAYVFHLRSIFPPSTPAAPTSDGSWKTHALALEKDLATMKEKYQAEQISRLASVDERLVNKGNPEALSAPAAPTSDSTPSGSQPVKRKPKKKLNDKPSEIPVRTDLATVLEDLGGRSEFVSLPGSDSLFATLSAFQQLASAVLSSEAAVTSAQRSLLLSTTTRALTALSNVLNPILRSTEITVASRATTLQTLAVLVHHIVSTSLPLLLRKPKRNTNQPATVSSLLNKLLDALITLIFDPILESFSPLSLWYLTSLLSPSPPAALPADLRPDVLHLFQSAFSPLVSAPSGYDVNLRGTLAVVALRELENLFPPRRTDGIRRPWTHDNRVKTLVRKDSLWYMCTILHVLFAPTKDCSTSGSSVRTNGAVSERRITDAFSRIVNRCRMCQDLVSRAASCNPEIADADGDDGKPSDEPPNDLDLEVIDEVGYGMILGVMERFWRWTGERHFHFGWYMI